MVTPEGRWVDWTKCVGRGTDRQTVSCHIFTSVDRSLERKKKKKGIKQDKMILGDNCWQGLSVSWIVLDNWSRRRHFRAEVRQLCQQLLQELILIGRLKRFPLWHFTSFGSKHERLKWNFWKKNVNENGGEKAICPHYRLKRSFTQRLRNKNKGISALERWFVSMGGQTEKYTQ